MGWTTCGGTPLPCPSPPAATARRVGKGEGESSAAYDCGACCRLFCILAAPAVPGPIREACKILHPLQTNIQTLERQAKRAFENPCKEAQISALSFTGSSQRTGQQKKDQSLFASAATFQNSALRASRRQRHRFEKNALWRLVNLVRISEVPQNSVVYLL